MELTASIFGLVVTVFIVTVVRNISSARWKRHPVWRLFIALAIAGLSGGFWVSVATLKSKIVAGTALASQLAGAAEILQKASELIALPFATGLILLAFTYRIENQCRARDEQLIRLTSDVDDARKILNQSKTRLDIVLSAPLQSAKGQLVPASQHVEASIRLYFKALDELHRSKK